MPAATWQLNDSWDIQVRNGTIRTVAGYLEVKQRLLVAFQHLWEEYFLNVPDGIPWYETILGTYDLKRVELILRRKALEVPGVVSILEFTATRSNTNIRHVDIYGLFEVEDIDGSYVQVPISLSVDDSSMEGSS